MTQCDPLFEANASPTFLNYKQLAVCLSPPCCKVKHEFMVEWVLWKQKHLLRHLGATDKETCLFNSACKLTSDDGHSVRLHACSESLWLCHCRHIPIGRQIPDSRLTQGSAGVPVVFQWLLFMQIFKEASSRCKSYEDCHENQNQNCSCMEFAPN